MGPGVGPGDGPAAGDGVGPDRLGGRSIEVDNNREKNISRTAGPGPPPPSRRIYASTLLNLGCFEEAKSLLRRTVPVARRVLGDSNDTTLRARQIYAVALCDDPAATLEDLREAMTTLEDAERITRRVFGGTHPLTVDIEGHLGHARAVLRARETPPNELDEVEDA